MWIFLLVEEWSGTVNLAVLVCLLRTTSRKRSSPFWGKKCTPQIKSWPRLCDYIIIVVYEFQWANIHVCVCIRRPSVLFNIAYVYCIIINTHNVVIFNLKSSLCWFQSEKEVFDRLRPIIAEHFDIDESSVSIGIYSVAHKVSHWNSVKYRCYILKIQILWKIASKTRKILSPSSSLPLLAITNPPCSAVSLR